MQCANLGGMEHSTLEMMSSLHDLGCSPRLVSLHPIAALGPLLEKRGIPARGLKYRRPWGMLSIPEMASESNARRRGCDWTQYGCILRVGWHRLFKKNPLYPFSSHGRPSALGLESNLCNGNGHLSKNRILRGFYS
jgi:hypothetical protein